MTVEVDPTHPFERFRCCGVLIDAVGLPDAADELISRALDREGGAAHLCNAYTLSIARRDPAFTDLLNRATYNFADGMPLVWVGRSRGMQVMRERVYGPDLMVEVVDRGRAAGLRHYLYGSTPDVLAALCHNLQARFPGADIVGVEAPPFRDLTAVEEDEVVERLSGSGAHIVWVGLGTPRQDHFVDALVDRVDAVLVPVGAAFDFHAGTLQQAPDWLQRRGLEWAYRLFREPRRLWKRYLIGNAVFLAGALRGAK